MNPYGNVDQGKYSDLVQSVLSSRARAQTPESLFEEDALLYGPVSKGKPPERGGEAGAPQSWFPLFSPERGLSPHAASDRSRLPSAILTWQGSVLKEPTVNERKNIIKHVES